VTDIEVVSPVPVDEIRPWLSTLATTFLENTEGDEFDSYVEGRRRSWDTLRTWGARADGRWVATLGTEPRSITVPSRGNTRRELAVDALTAVTVNATHRRRGMLTQMLTESLHAAKLRGDPFSILIAAEWPIYGRFGYSPTSQLANYTVTPRGGQNLLDPTDSGSVRQVDPADLTTVATDVFDRARAFRAGQVDRLGDWWPRRLGLDGYRAVHSGKAPNYYLHEGADGPDGLLSWMATRDFDITGDMGAIEVRDLIAASETAYHNLWAYLTSIDVVSEIALRHRPVDEQIRWQLRDGRALRLTYAGDDLWLRLLDVPTSLAARSYAVAGRVVFDVVDEDIGGYATGRYLLEADDSGNAECVPTTEGANLRISQRTLASIYLGGFSLRQLALTGGTAELTAGAQERVDTMFATPLQPWNATGF
jgi:predicted acetyltransferase